MRNSAFYIVFYIVVSILILEKISYADDVYNFQFQKTQEIAPASPTVVAPAPIPSPITPGKSTYWKYSAGYGFNQDFVGRVEGVVLGVGYNFNEYFGLNSTYLFKQKFNPEYDYYANQDHLNKFDVGFNFTPLSLRSFGLELLEFTFYGGITSIHNPPKDESMRATEDYQGYIGLGINANFTKDFSIETTTKTLANQIFFRNHNFASEHFTYISYNLVWRI